MTKASLGILFAIIAAVTYGMNPLFALPLYHRHYCTEAVLILRYLPAAVIIGLMAWRQKVSFHLTRREMLIGFPACALCGLSSLFLYISYNLMDSGVASTLLFVYPLMTALIMCIFFHEKLRWTTMLAIALSLGGVAMLCKQGDGSSISGFGLLMVMLSALTYAIYLAIAGKGVINNIPKLTLTFYIMVIAVVIYAVKMAVCTTYSDIGTLWGSISTVVLFSTLGLTLLPTVISFHLVTLAVRYVGSTPAAIIGALEPLSAVFFGVCVFHEAFTIRLLLGIVFILSGVIITIVRK